jgi:transposase
MLRATFYDGQGFWLAQKRLSKGRFVWWPSGPSGQEPTQVLEAHQAQILLLAGNSDAKGAPVWRRVSVEPSP